MRISKIIQLLNRKITDRNIVSEIILSNDLLNNLNLTDSVEILEIL